MIQDFKFAVRQLIKTPGFTAIAVLTLALAIGVNSAIFALVNGVVLRPMVPCAAGSGQRFHRAPEGGPAITASFPGANTASCATIFGLSCLAASNLAWPGSGAHEMRRSFAFLTSENFFSLMGVQPVIGRFYNAEECGRMRTFRWWSRATDSGRRMGGRPGLSGAIFVNGQPYTVIGVTPSGFSGVSTLVAPDV